MDKAADHSGADKTFTEKTVLKYLVPSHASWPVREDWKVFEYMQEGSGATLDVMIVPMGDVSTKLPLMISDLISIIFISSSVVVFDFIRKFHLYTPQIC